MLAQKKKQIYTEHALIFFLVVKYTQRETPAEKSINLDVIDKCFSKYFK